jgi:hypothetical protein
LEDSNKPYEIPFYISNFFFFSIEKKNLVNSRQDMSLAYTWLLRNNKSDNSSWGVMRNIDFNSFILIYVHHHNFILGPKCNSINYNDL